MSCVENRDAIAEWMDGALEPTRQRALERHAESCEACRALVADLRSIQAAAFTLDRLEVPAGTWEHLQRRLRDETVRTSPGGLLAWRPSRTTIGAWAAFRPRPVHAAAAALVLATTIGIVSLVPGRSAGPARDAVVDSAGDPTDLVASVQAELKAAEGHYDKAIQGLEQIARSESGALDIQVAAVLQKNLHVIDAAIGESRAALASQPASADAQESLFESMRSKVALLQQTVELINEMRQGNQAEAGRLIQVLSQ